LRAVLADILLVVWKVCWTVVKVTGTVSPMHLKLASDVFEFPEIYRVATRIGGIGPIGA